MIARLWRRALRVHRAGHDTNAAFHAARAWEAHGKPTGSTPTSTTTTTPTRSARRTRQRRT